MNRKWKGFGFGCALMGLGVCVGVLGSNRSFMGSLGVESATASRGAFLQDEENTISVFKRVAPSVVNIDTTAVRRDFFSMSIMEVPRGSGSGFVWDKLGHIVTNFHVIENASRIHVSLREGQSFEAKLIGQAPDKDLAVLKIDAPADALLPVEVGRTDELEVGQKVLAIGNPFGLDQTLTVGVVSATGREIQSQTGRRIQDVVQTDAAINPGNSGGPLLDSQGRLIGVNTQIYSPSGASAGIGFAVPVNAVKRVVPQLVKFGQINRPTLGVRLLSDAIASRNGIEGVIIESVEPGSPADLAGIRGLVRTRSGYPAVGDIIVGIGEGAVKNYNDLLDELEKHKPGDAIRVTVQRGDQGKKRTVTVKTQ